MLIQVPEQRTGKNRLHVDLAASDWSAELDRLVGLGAKHLDEHDGLRHPLDDPGRPRGQRLRPGRDPLMISLQNGQGLSSCPAPRRAPLCRVTPGIGGLTNRSPVGQPRRWWGDFWGRCQARGRLMGLGGVLPRQPPWCGTRAVSCAGAVAGGGWA